MKGFELLLEKEAQSFRTQFGLNNSEPIRLKSFLQKLNVITVFSPLSDRFSGMAVKNQSGEKIERFMLVNNSLSLGKQHFTICHELYHLFIQHDFTSQICIAGKFDPKADINEYKADIFASYLLLPNEGLMSNIPDRELVSKMLSLGTILSIEQFFSCSRRALLNRLRNLGLLKPIQYDEFSRGIKRGALENGFTLELYEKGNEHVVIGDYGILARKLFDTDKISQSHYYSLLKDEGIDLNKLTDTANGEF